MKICADCISGVVLPGTAEGTMFKLGALAVYLASPPACARASVADTTAIVLFTDVFGLPLGNPKIMAESFAKELGLDVWVPDMFNGHPALNNDDIMPYDHQDAGSPIPWWKWLGFMFTMATVFPKMMFGENSQSKVYARMKTFLETLQKEKGIMKVGAVGYCHGGSVIMSLVPHHLVSSAVICHPGDVNPNLVDSVDFPSSWVTCEEDFTFGPKKAEEVEAQFAARERKAKQAGGPAPPPYEFKRYTGTRHGFACRPALDVPVVKEAFERAAEQTVGWFRKTLL